MIYKRKKSELREGHWTDIVQARRASGIKMSCESTTPRFPIWAVLTECRQLLGPDWQRGPRFLVPGPSSPSLFIGL